MLRALLALLVLVGCGQAGEVAAPREPVVPMALKTFKAENWRLANNKFFLWKENLSPEDVSRAKAIANRIDDLDTLAVPLNRTRFSLEERIDPLKEDVRLLSKHHRSLKRVVGKTKAAVKKAKSELKKHEDALQAEREKPQPSSQVEEDLVGKIAAARATVEALESQLEQVEPVEQGVGDEISELKAELEPLEEEMAELEEKQLAIELEGREKVDQIMQVVDWYKDQPSAVVFQFQEDGSISASITGWNLSDGVGARRFSTMPGAGDVATIRNVQYQELGGVFTFEVLVFEDPSVNEKLREVYAFKISRSNYEADDGRRFFTGEITRTRQTEKGTEVRKGVAKLVDRNN